MEIQVKQLVLAIKTIAEEKNLPAEIVHDIIEQAIAAAWRKDFGDKEQEVTASINTGSGDVTIFIHKEVVATADDVEDEDTQVSLADAKKVNEKAEVEGTVEYVEKPTTFGRVAAQTAKQVILQKLREAEREIVLEEYSDKIGQVLNGVVQRVESRLVRVDLGKAQGILPASEQIPNEYYQTGGRIKVFLKDVERGNRGPQLILSRANEEFIKDLFRNEVPEMESGAVEIKAISREAGVRTKIAVASSVPGVDPVGTFVGGHGTRVQAVMSEIGDQEKIDIVTFDEDIKGFISNALSPTEVVSVEINDSDNKAVVKVPEDQLSVAIGKGGQNVRLASKLAGYDIDIESNSGDAEPAAKAAPAKPAADTPTEAPKKPRRMSKRDSMEDSLLTALEGVAEDETETVVEAEEPAKTEEDEPKEAAEESVAEGDQTTEDKDGEKA